MTCTTSRTHVYNRSVRVNLLSHALNLSCSHLPRNRQAIGTHREDVIPSKYDRASGDVSLPHLSLKDPRPLAPRKPDLLRSPRSRTIRISLKYMHGRPCVQAPREEKRSTRSGEGGSLLRTIRSSYLVAPHLKQQILWPLPLVRESGHAGGISRLLGRRGSGGAFSLSRDSLRRIYASKECCRRLHALSKFQRLLFVQKSQNALKEYYVRVNISPSIQHGG